MNRLAESEGPSLLTKTTTDGITINEKAEDMPQLKAGPFVRLENGRLVTIARVADDNSAKVYVSDDQGLTWDERPLGNGSGEILPAPSGALAVTPEGTLILGLCNIAEKSKWEWDPEIKDCLDSSLPAYAARSTDMGDTWSAQKLHDEWTGATRDIIQPRDGSVVFTSMKHLHNPGRHAVITYRSEDDGKSWTASNIIDLGGNGHHDGAMEGTMVELKDGRLLQYLRTNWGGFWRAESDDSGRTWHPYGPAGVDASSTPGKLKRLASGRIVLIWNRRNPESGEEYPVQGGDGIWSATPASNFRRELSISFSEDECQSWSPPVVIAKHPESTVCYPCVFEVEPGVLWVTAWRWKLRIQLHEKDFLRGGSS